MQTYQHGGDIKAFAKKVGCAESEVIDLSSNINFVHPNVTLDFDIRSYPNYETLYESLATHFKVQSSELELFNGGSSAIFSLFRELKNETCVLYSPAYLEYKKAALLCKKELIMIDRFSNLYADIPQNSLVIFVNPSTPDGKLYDMKKLFRLWREKNCTIMIDESFIEFTDASSMSKYIYDYDKLYILKSLTKFYACAGVRMGIVLSNKTNILALKEKEPLWKISSHDSAYIQAVLKDKTFIKYAKEENQKAKHFLKEILKEYEIYDSDANFFLLKLEGITAQELQEKLAPFAIMIRDCSNFDFLDERFVRIAVKSIDDLKKLQEAL